jgi:hypothetical protein
MGTPFSARDWNSWLYYSLDYNSRGALKLGALKLGALKLGALKLGALKLGALKLELSDS